jgi:hypothetical protein
MIFFLGGFSRGFFWGFFPGAGGIFLGRLFSWGIFSMDDFYWGDFFWGIFTPCPVAHSMISDNWRILFLGDFSQGEIFFLGG